MAEALLFEHEDGRYAVNPDTTGDPKWHRIGPVDVSALSTSMSLDFKQASDILAMFGGEPGEVTLLTGDGHSGRGLYAYYSDYPEEGAEFLGVADEEAMPVADAGEAAEAQSTTNATALREVRNLIADDAHALTFQSFGQYRTALLKSIDATLAAIPAAPMMDGGLRDADLHAIHSLPYVRDCLLSYARRPCDDEAAAVVKAIATQIAALAQPAPVQPSKEQA